ncbi:hypothetical protein CCYN2B_110135 [Capnocytophaga cynodegmi]|uniref:Uncharacterized protein n=1 Tax=Capnocytophaga cynodegmi TaxID=28189 RepID=A0A0B7GZ76_9FLAO|nr:hypothetical protein CCYN2B_110135 [Capnocytophaga cynodegmi]
MIQVRFLARSQKHINFLFKNLLFSYLNFNLKINLLEIKKIYIFDSPYDYGVLICSNIKFM